MADMHQDFAPAEPAGMPCEQQVDATTGFVMATVVSEEPPLQWPEVVALILIVVLCDLTIYRGHGFAGYSLLFVAAPFLLALGSPHRQASRKCWIVGAMMLFLAAQLLWSGSLLPMIVGFVLVIAFAVSLSGHCPHVLELIGTASRTLVAGCCGLSHYRRCLDKVGPTVSRARWLSVALPMTALVVFGLLFVLANPDLRVSFGVRIERFLDAWREWMLAFSPSAWEVVFWAATLVVGVGLLRPRVSGLPVEQKSSERSFAQDQKDVSSPLYAAFRNTLLAVIVLFACYLVFEFKTLWFCVFPEGFYYSGYAHEGAAWLTVALVLATLTLSMVFCGATLRDPQLPRLRRLAWIWSLENMLLAAAVYHRLYIYIGFNGMTRMRMVGIFGMTAVVVGFILVVWKIVHNHGFVWLMQRHLWTLAIAVYLFSVTPVDAIVTQYNVQRILSGDPSPSVQISVHPISSEGVLLLTPLVQCDDSIIREGIRAMLAQCQIESEALAVRRQTQGWTAYQIADNLLLQTLRNSSADWEEYTRDVGQRKGALNRFHKYAYQWY